MTTLSRLFALSLAACSFAPAEEPKLLKVADFETGDLSQLGTQKAQEDSLTIVTSPVRVCMHAAKTLLRATDPEVNKGQRAEFSDGKRGTQYPEELGPYAKFGQYHSVDEKAPQNVVFFDEYRVAGPGGSYDLVAPSGKSPSKQ